MLDLSTSIGIQSWCFRSFKTTEALLNKIKTLGLRRVELCGVHVDFNDEAGFPRVMQQFKAAGVQITSIGVQTFRDDAATEEKWFRFCQMAGAKMIAADIDVASMPAGLQTAQKLAEKYEIPLGIHNHGGNHWLGNVQMLRNIFTHMGPRVGLCLDTAWCLQTGDDPLKWAEEFHDRLYGVHVKDFVFDRAGKWTDVVIGKGNLRLRELLKVVAGAPRLETLTLEYEGDVDNPAPALRECLTEISAMI